MISPFGPTGSNCLIPPPKWMPIPAAIITKVIFFMLLYAPDFGYSIVSESVTPPSPTSPDFSAYPHPNHYRDIAHIWQAISESSYIFSCIFFNYFNLSSVFSQFPSNKPALLSAPIKEPSSFFCLSAFIHAVFCITENIKRSNKKSSYAALYDNMRHNLSKSTTHFMSIHVKLNNI